MIHVPSTHEVSVIDSIRAGWVRARVLAPREGQPAYSASPQIAALSRLHIGRHGRGRQRRDHHRRGGRGVRGSARTALPAAACTGGSRPRRWSSTWRRATAGRSGGRSPRSPSPVPKTATSNSTRPPARSCSDRPSGSPTERCARTGRCRRRARCCASAAIAQVGAGGPTSLPRAITILRSSIPYGRQRRQPLRRRRWDRRRGPRERQGARPDRAAHPQPRGHRRGLRAARTRGCARDRTRAGSLGRRRRRRHGCAYACSSSLPSPTGVTAGCGSSSSCPTTTR